MAEVTRQVALGPRAPGLPGHEALRTQLRQRLEQWADEVCVQEFTVYLPAGAARCANLAGVFRGGRSHPKVPRSPQGAAGGWRRAAAPKEGQSGGRLPSGSPQAGGLLLGSHFDTRLRADREPDPRLRERPIPGANDGGSGTAVLLDMLPDLAAASRAGTLARDVTVVFFDAEDIGEIAGYSFSYGARRFVAQLPVRRPAEVIVLDMVGGRNLLLDLDAHALHHEASWALTGRLFGLGAQLAGGAFAVLSQGGRSAAGAREGELRSKLRYIISDQIPFVQEGIAACLLIDLDYPQWHTQADLPEAMDPRALSTISEVLRRYVSGLAGSDPRGFPECAGPGGCTFP
jgi:hypothetical protein